MLTILKFALYMIPWDDTLLPFVQFDYGWCREPVALNFFGVDSEEYYLFLSLIKILFCGDFCGDFCACCFRHSMLFPSLALHVPGTSLVCIRVVGKGFVLGAIFTSTHTMLLNFHPLVLCLL